SLSESTRSKVVWLVTHPIRNPRAPTVNAAVGALKLAPERNDVRRMWARWILDGKFDGVEENLENSDYAVRCLTEISEEGADNDGYLARTLKSHIRQLARTADRAKIRIAINYLIASARRCSPLLSAVAEELDAATGSAEWK